MNYIWEAAIRAVRSGKPRKELRFEPAEQFSPYMELSLPILNAKSVESPVEVNPYYRFHDLFQPLLDPNVEEESEFRRTLFDLLVHFLADMDRWQGMNKREFHIRFVLQDVLSGVLGEAAGKKLALFGQDEQDVIGANLLRLYDSGEALYLLKDTIRKLYPGTTIYSNSSGKHELIIYLSEEESLEEESKLELLLELFLPLHYEVELYWRRHFGVIGFDESMRMDQIALY